MGEPQVTAAVPPVVRLANDIARQFAHLPPPEAARAVAAHLDQFWEPRMRTALVEEVATDPDRLDPLVLAALDPPPA
ncbi:formate dehydrogenase subunit delta [Nocardioides taihuensis]|uniref:Formate dehydrogenase subunit delta n=1 Tax=Nocardioides taihuensis TaxID=1835606 RepID=A0ABW0BFQ5_9ACTN